MAVQFEFHGVPIVCTDTETTADRFIRGIESLPPQPAVMYATLEVIMQVKGWGRAEALTWLHGNARLGDGFWIVEQAKLGGAGHA